MSAAGTARWVWAICALGAVLCAAGAGRAEEPNAPSTIRVSLWLVEARELDAEFEVRAREQVEQTLRSVGLFEVVSPAKDAGGEDPFGPDCFSQLACVQRLGKAQDLAVVFELQMAKSLGGVRYSLSSFSTQTGLKVRKVEDFSERKREDIERALRWLTLKASSPMITTLASGKGSLQIDCAEADAALFINGKPFGKKVGKRFRVSAGVFEIVVNKEGFMPYHDVVMIQSRGEATVKAKLKKVVEEPKLPDQPDGGLVAANDPNAPDGGPKPFLPDGRTEGPDGGGEPPPPAFYETWWFWTVVGVGLAGAGGATAYFLLQDSGPSGVGGFEVSWP